MAVRSLHLGVVIAAAPGAVYAYAADPDHLPLWAAGLASGEAHRDGDALVVDSPMGRVVVRFVPPNHLGVLDHDVELPTGEVVTNPLRVLAHPDGAEVVFTLRQLPGVSDEDLERDAEVVRRDLARLRDLLEAGPTAEVSPPR